MACHHVCMCADVCFIIVWKLVLTSSAESETVKEVKEEASQDNEPTRKEKQGQSLATFNVRVSFIFTVIWQPAGGWLGQQI